MDAAHYYPAIYWYSLLTIPDKNEFGGENGIPANVTQQEWLVTLKNRACVGCHQLGQEATRTIPAAFADQKTSVDAWMRRVQSGQSAPFMVNPLAGQLGGAPFKYFADWTDRIAQGELPKAQPPRPEGVERNLVITEWDWGRPDKYLHDLISTDKRQPTVNANGKLYGSPEYSTDELPILDPTTNTVTYFRAPVRDPGMPLSLGDGHAATVKPEMPSAYWGDRQIWDTRVNNHNMMIDRKGRVWLTASVRGLDNPAFCKAGSDHPSAKLFPLNQSHRQLAMFDPQTMKYTFVDTCFDTHHLQFGFDKDDTLWTSGGGPVVGWLDTKVFDETGDAAKAQGWTALVLDTDGNGKRDAYVEPNQPVDPNKDKRISGGFYAIMPSPVDASVWGTVGVFAGKGAVVRLDPGPNPPATALAEIYNVPRRALDRAAPISTARVLCGCRSAAAISAASIGANARPRRTGPRRPAISAPKAGPCTNIRVRALPASATTAPRRAITPGSTSTIRWGSGTMFRSRPAMKTTRCWRWSTGNGWCCAFPIR